LKERAILLIEDDPVEAALSVRALRQNKILNEIVVALDDAEIATLYATCNFIRQTRPKDCASRCTSVVTGTPTGTDAGCDDAIC